MASRRRFFPLRASWLVSLSRDHMRGALAFYHQTLCCAKYTCRFRQYIDGFHSIWIRPRKAALEAPTLYVDEYGLLEGKQLHDHADLGVIDKSQCQNDECIDASDTERSIVPMTLAEACANLLVEVFKTAGVDRKRASSERERGNKKRTCVIDLGFGCGDQTACLMGTFAPYQVKDSIVDYDGRFGLYFEDYVGLTLDEKQYRFALERVRPSNPGLGRNLRRPRSEFHEVKIDMFCADAAKPDLWDAKIKACVQEAVERSQVRWVLALDTAYHFSPSRWPVVKHACQTLGASFAAFDLCLSPTASLREKLLLRLLTTLMGAPWANFVTPEQYRTKLIEAGYDAAGITIRDISEDVFGPLSEFLARQDRGLRVIGLSLGPLNVARLMFSWWARSGVVRGIIVVAKREDKQGMQRIEV